ncbi:hypothetical protein [Pontibacter sp. G13]|nr:hypothetical protein [Pontibacter sp. G13]WNJ20398.1 hypothetical protein RJD25_07945 [Pontibacter sp. G13]
MHRKTIPVNDIIYIIGQFVQTPKSFLDSVQLKPSQAIRPEF